MAEVIAKSLISPGQLMKKLNANPRAITALSNYITEVEKLLQLPLIDHNITARHSLRWGGFLFILNDFPHTWALRLNPRELVN